MNSTPPRHTGPGRPKGSKDSIPRSVKASIRLACERIGKKHPKLIEERILAGVNHEDMRIAFPYIQMVAHYIDGKPKETHEHKVPEAVRVVHEFTTVTVAK